MGCPNLGYTDQTYTEDNFIILDPTEYAVVPMNSWVYKFNPLSWTREYLNTLQLKFHYMCYINDMVLIYHY